eukprot:RCo007980
MALALRRPPPLGTSGGVHGSPRAAPGSPKLSGGKQVQLVESQETWERKQTAMQAQAAQDAERKLDKFLSCDGVRSSTNKVVEREVVRFATLHQSVQDTEKRVDLLTTSVPSRPGSSYSRLPAVLPSPSPSQGLVPPS